MAICTELNTLAGPIDNFMVTPSGLPVLVECKLWRNPEARREVVSQILDYAKELSRWSSSDVQREVSHRLKRDGNPLLDIVRKVDPEIDEREFNDALTKNLRRGRFLLLIVGNGIREGVEAIAEYLRLHAGLRFSLGLVELPIYCMPNGDSIKPAQGLTLLGPAWASRRPHQPPCGTGFWPGRDIAAGWREIESPARLCRPGRQASRAHPRGKPGFSTCESGCGRETDSPLEGARFEPSVPG